MSDCIFCLIAEGKIPADIVFEGANVLAFRDIDPKAPTHVVIIPKRHINPLNDLEEEDILVIPEMYMAARAVAAGEEIDQSGYRLVANTGPDSGQEVEHMHWHVLGGRRLGGMG
jgi:histidine triad (HIT) family protein